MEEVREGHVLLLTLQAFLGNIAVTTELLTLPFLDSCFAYGLRGISIFLCVDSSVWLGTRRGGVLGYSVFHCIFRSARTQPVGCLRYVCIYSRRVHT